MSTLEPEIEGRYYFLLGLYSRCHDTFRRRKTKIVKTWSLFEDKAILSKELLIDFLCFLGDQK